MRPRLAGLLSLVALTGLVAGCGGGSVAYHVPKSTPVLTAPPSGGTPAPGTSTGTTATTSTTSTTSTTPAAVTPSTSGGTSATPPATSTAPANTGGTGTPTQTTATTPSNPGGSGGADFNAFCQQNPGAC